MNKGLKFTISGDMACFRKPETNSSVYITFGAIHKVALVGLLGAVLGLKGYEQQKEKDFPEFYKELINLKISIVAPKKNIIQKINTFNNSTGIASLEDGGNLIVKESILLGPSWDIYVLDDNSEIYNKLKDYILNQKTEFIPYLGRNDYPASITDASEVDLEDMEKEEVLYDSYVQAKISDIVKTDEIKFVSAKFFKSEQLPVALDENTFHYIYENFLLTNDYISKKDNSYCCNNLNLMFV